MGGKRANGELVEVDLRERIHGASPPKLGDVVGQGVVEDVQASLGDESVDGEQLGDTARTEDGPVVELAGGQGCLTVLADVCIAVDGFVRRGREDVDGKDEIR